MIISGMNITSLQLQCRLLLADFVLYYSDVQGKLA